MLGDTKKNHLIFMRNFNRLRISCRFCGLQRSQSQTEECKATTAAYFVTEESSTAVHDGHLSGIIRHHPACIDDVQPSMHARTTLCYLGYCVFKPLYNSCSLGLLGRIYAISYLMTGNTACMIQGQDIDGSAMVRSSCTLTTTA